MIAFAVVVLIVLSVVNLAVVLKLLRRESVVSQSRASRGAVAAQSEATGPAEPAPAPDAAEEAFAVPRRERRPSWRERRRQLEAAHRTERKKLEEWRD